MWDGVKAEQPVRDVALALCEAYGLNGICDPGFAANTLARERTSRDPYFTIGDRVYCEPDPSDPRSGDWWAIPEGLTIEELRAVDSRPWTGPCAISGATMRDFADALAAVKAPAWVKRATVSLCRSYASTIDWRKDARDVATRISSALCA
jgi:hypothetical protein